MGNNNNLQTYIKFGDDDYQLIQTPAYNTKDLIISVDIAKDTSAGLDDSYTSWYKEKTKPTKLWRSIWQEKE